MCQCEFVMIFYRITSLTLHLYFCLLLTKWLNCDIVLFLIDAMVRSVQNVISVTFIFYSCFYVCTLYQVAPLACAIYTNLPVVSPVLILKHHLCTTIINCSMPTPLTAPLQAPIHLLNSPSTNICLHILLNLSGSFHSSYNS